MSHDMTHETALIAPPVSRDGALATLHHVLALLPDGSSRTWKSLVNHAVMEADKPVADLPYDTLTDHLEDLLREERLIRSERGLPIQVVNRPLAFGLAFLGVGLGLFMTPATMLAIGEAPADKAALAGGIFKMGSSLGGAFGIAVHLAIFGAVLQGSGNVHLAARISIGAGLLAAVLASLVPCFLSPAPKA